MNASQKSNSDLHLTVDGKIQEGPYSLDTNISVWDSTQLKMSGNIGVIRGKPAKTLQVV